VKAIAFPDKSAVRRSFERAARDFDVHAILHREVAARLVEHLDPIRVDPSLIVDLGCGTGALFEAMNKRYPRASVVGLDIAHAMLVRARNRAPWWRRALGGSGLRLVCGDAERLPLARACAALVVSNLALHWCRPEAFFAEAARTLSPGGLLLFSTFGPDTLKELRAAFAAVDGAAHVHAFVDMHDLGDALVHAGFADPVMEMEVITLEYANVQAMARELRGTGSRNAMPARARGLMGRGRWQRVLDGYEARRRAGVLPATFEVVYGHAWKVKPKVTADGRQVIDFQPRERA